MKILKFIVGLFICACLLGGFIAATYIIKHKDNPLVRLETLPQALFSPDDKLRDLLIALIDAEKKHIKIAIYTITDKAIASALVRAARGDAGRQPVHIECVVDPGYEQDRYSKVYQLANAQIPIWVYGTSNNSRHSSLMHNKFCLFSCNGELNRSLVWTGSFNFTIRAHERNQENVIVSDDKRLFEQFCKQFEVLKERSLLINEDTVRQSVASNVGKLPVVNKKRANGHDNQSSWIDSLKGFWSNI